jgi:molecular chaperone DnaK (HSP70)
MKPLETVVEESGIEKDEIQEIVLVGHSTHVLKIQKLV